MTTRSSPTRLATARDELAYLLDSGPDGPLEEHYREHAAAVQALREEIAAIEARA